MRWAQRLKRIAQVSGTYGHNEAQTVVENCGNTLILRCSSSENGGTARFASKLIGEREILREHVTKGRSGGPFFADDHRSVSTSIQHVTESAVLPSEIDQLPDPQGFLKFASTPSWTASASAFAEPPKVPETEIPGACRIVAVSRSTAMIGR